MTSSKKIETNEVLGGLTAVCSDALCAELERCRTDAFLVAPFAKAAVMARIFRHLSPEVALTVVTRWRPNEVAVGVTDLDVFDQCRTRARTKLLLFDRLHAKYYRAGSALFIGSANLTFAGMGWSSSPNLEILHEVSLSTAWEQFEARLSLASILATEEIRSAVQAAADGLEIARLAPSDGVRAQSGAEEASCVAETWLPALRSPASLKDCYFGRRERVSSAAYADGTADLLVLRVPGGLSETQFLLWVRAALVQQSFFAKLKCWAADRPRFGTLRARVQREFDGAAAHRDVTEITQALMRWAVFFFPERFRIRVYRYTESLEYLDREALE